MDHSIEEKWRKIWEERGAFEADPDERKKKVLATVPFPYMNGPLHLGHAFTDGRVDVYARYKRMQRENTLFPYAWHWTGQPLVAAAERLANGDPSMVKEFVEIEKVPQENISKFYNPVYMASYYTSEGKESLKRLGLSIDWRREFHTSDLEPAFSKFVLWQMNRLRDKGYVTRGTHPVVWCPKDKSPTGDHDRLEGEGVTWEEFVLVLFPESDHPSLLLPAATLRPETIYGVTNIWINPQSTYCEVSLNEKSDIHWIVSSKAVKKLDEQLKKLKVIREFSGRELVGSRVRHPIEKQRSLLVLPGAFVDPDNGTGIVYSVPAHAPADYVALRDLKNSQATLNEFNLNEKEVQGIELISLISIPNMGQYPAAEIVEKMKVKNQNDPLLEQATGEIYRKEFHQGVMNERTGEFQGMRVSEAKPKILAILKQKGLADHLFELPERVVCRCTTECIVKILEDQWFLRYSDQDWKKMAHECVNSMSVYPDSARQWFHDVIDWYKDWPCARRVGLGTPLPWSQGWIVETLSDSTIYMAFYTIISTIRQRKVPVESLTQKLFDYVFLSEGTLELVASETNIDPKTIEEMHSQFRYWYPVNLRNSAKELIPNHLTFFIFQHVAFFPKDLWPTAISANGMLTHDGAKMSKSRGNVVTLKNALDSYGADVVRAAVLGGSEGLEDVDWRDKDVFDMKGKIESLESFIAEVFSLTKTNDLTGVDKPRHEEDLWLESQVQHRVSRVIQSIDEMKTKTAFHEAFYNFWGDVRYYLKRTENPSKEVLFESLGIWVKLLSPFIPFTSEELNYRLGGRDLVSTSEFPKPDPSKINLAALVTESSIQNLIEDARSIMKVLRSPAAKLHIYLAPAWSYEMLYLLIKSRKSGEDTRTSDMINEMFKRFPDLPKSEIAAMLPKANKVLNQLGEEFIGSYSNVYDSLREDRVYKESSSYIERELGVKIIVEDATNKNRYDPKEKARYALPYKPALYFE